MNNTSLTISKIIHGGYGLGTLEDGRKAMILHALPDEELTFRVTEQKKSYITGTAREILKSSPHRIEPPCPWYGTCGGCDLQHGTYEAQLQIKAGIVADLLARELPDIVPAIQSQLIRPPLASPVQFHYRQRVRFWVGKDGSFGFRKHRSHQLVQISACMLAVAPINTVINELKNHSTFRQLLAHTREFELLFNPSTEKITILLHRTRKPRPAETRLADQLVQQVELIERVFFRGEQFPITPVAPAGTGNRMSTELKGIGAGASPLSLSWEVGGFCQVNLAQNLNLIQLVLDRAAVSAEQSVLDLFCGAGNFSLPLALSAKHVTGIEGQGAAIRSAIESSASAGLTNTSFIKSPINTACEQLRKKGQRFDCLVIDPPRQGMPGLAETISDLCTKRLIYISCDPATLCRDLAALSRCGFNIQEIWPVDMFPQTHHIETVAVLEKN